MIRPCPTAIAFGLVSVVLCGLIASKALGRIVAWMVTLIALAMGA